MKITFNKASNYKTFGLKTSNGTTSFGNKSQPPTNNRPFIPMDEREKEKIKHSALEK
jgi:hypothetical protein